MNSIKQWKMRGIALTLFFAFFFSSALPATLVWEKDEDGDVTGYKVYFIHNTTAFPPIDVGLATNHQLTNLDSSFVYSIFVTAYNSSGLESHPSTVVRYPHADECHYALSFEAVTLDAEPMNGSFEVISEEECYWSIAKTEPWISITSMDEHTGPATVSFSVRRNRDKQSRRGIILAADRLFVITQSGADDPPAIVEPLQRTLNLNEDASEQLRVGATGTALRFQWFKDGMLLPGATNSVLKLTSAKAEDAGDYTVDVFNSAAVLLEGPVTVSVLLKPIILPGGQPQSITTEIGEFSSLSVRATGTDLHFSWFKDSVVPVGEDLPSLEFASVGVEDFAMYHVVITNPAGFTISEDASVSLRNPDQPPAKLAIVTEGGELQLSVFGKPGATYEVLLSTDLLTWLRISTVRVEIDGTARVLLPHFASKTSPSLFLRTVRW